mgnify:CR=1 FL=1
MRKVDGGIGHSETSLPEVKVLLLIRVFWPNRKVSLGPDSDPEVLFGCVLIEKIDLFFSNVFFLSLQNACEENQSFFLGYVYWLGTYLD